MSASFERRELPSIKEVMEATAARTTRQVDEVEGSVMPFFLSAAADLLRRAKEEKVQTEEVLARVLAVAAGLKELPSHSLLTWRPGDTTLELKKEKEWQGFNDAEGW
ncbi:DEAD/DEAH box helicase, putative [Eimeria brunetti]|uniref:DEAD/DEAH box helicase, putative n=1 Tax=Eimeria brunetti TaxID=51314 RepID=U6LM45_9EIME|nr:DEAD/DEAH box helicase, putative [Eimeria brunetti]